MSRRLTRMDHPTVFLLWTCITHTLVLLYNIFSHLSIDFDNFLSQLTFYHLQKLGFLMFQGSKNASWWRYGKKVRRMLPRRPAGAGSQAAFPCHSEAFLLRTARISATEYIVRASCKFVRIVENGWVDWNLFDSVLRIPDAAVPFFFSFLTIFPPIRYNNTL